MKMVEKGALVIVQQITVALTNPGEHLAKVIEVIEGVFQRLGHRTSGSVEHGHGAHKAVYLYS